MNKIVCRALIVAAGIGSSAILAAQSGTPATGPGARQSAPSPAPTNQSLASTVTVTGCLQRGSANVDAGASGAPPAGQNATTAAGFILSNAVPSGSGAGGRSTAADAGAPAQAGAATAPGSTTQASSDRGPATAPGRTYTLIEGKTGELTPHVGHQIQVTGSLAGAATTGGPTGTSGARGAAGSTPVGGSGSSSVANQRLQVTAIQMVSPTCPGPTASPTSPPAR